MNFTSLLSIKAKHVSGLTLSFKMQRARYPCRQLNSRTIKSAALCYLSPVVLGKCSIIGAKCACKVQEEGFESAWNGVSSIGDEGTRAKILLSLVSALLRLPSSHTTFIG